MATLFFVVPMCLSILIGLPPFVLAKRKAPLPWYVFLTPYLGYPFWWVLLTVFGFDHISISTGLVEAFILFIVFSLMWWIHYLMLRWPKIQNKALLLRVTMIFPIVFPPLLVIFMPNLPE